MSMSGSPKTTTRTLSRTACTLSFTRYCRKRSALSHPSPCTLCSMSSTPGPNGILTDLGSALDFREFSIFSNALCCNAICHVQDQLPKLNTFPSSAPQLAGHSARSLAEFCGRYPLVPRSAERRSPRLEQVFNIEVSRNTTLLCPATPTD